MQDSSKLYYTPERMKDKKLSELEKDKDFLTDAYTFLLSGRKNWTEDELSGLSTSEVVDEVQEHFRLSTMNEVTMGKDFYYVSDEEVPETDKQAYGRLLFAFDNAKGEGILDKGVIADYAEGALTAPSTYASAAAGAFTFGSGGAAVQAGKMAAQQGLRKVANKYLGRAALAGVVDGSVAAGSAYGLEKVKVEAGDEIGENYEVNYGTVALGGVLGGALGAASYAVPQAVNRRAATRLTEVLDKGAAAKVKELAEAAENANQAIKLAKTSDEGKRYLKFSTDLLMRSIDPKLVEEGRKVKVDILSDGLPDGLVGGLPADTLKRLGAATYELTSKLRVKDPETGKLVKFKPESGQRITEFLAKAMDNGFGGEEFAELAGKYGLSARQLSSVYAAEVSDAARILVGQKNLKNLAGKAVPKEQIASFKNSLDKLYDEGMASVTGAEAFDKSIVSSGGITGKTWRRFKDIENARRALMTSQPATTMRNNIFGVAMTGIDALDTIGLGVVKALKGDVKGGYTTAKSAVDVFSYLTKDAYVAKAFTEMMSQEAPQQMSRVFFDAAQAEATFVGDTNLAKLGKAANVLNTMSDHVFKRAVLTGSIDRQLKAAGNEALGTSVYDMLGKGTLSQLPNDMLDKALDDSLSFTFQRKFGQKGSSQMSQNTRDVVSFINKSGLTVLMPFPRYMASQAKFISDYTGLTIARRLASGSSVEDEAFAKAATGAAMFAGLYQVQKKNVQEDREWYVAEDDAGTPYNATAALGPSATLAYLANLAVRLREGAPVKDSKAILKDLNKLLIGTEFRPNSGISDKIVRAVESGNTAPLVDAIGDYFSAYTYPAAVVKDFYGQFDPRASYFPETRDAQVSMLDVGFGDFSFELPMSSWMRFTRQLPDFGGLGESEKGILNFFTSSPDRMDFQEKGVGGVKDVDKGYDALKMSIFGNGPLRAQNPMMKQLSGFSGERPKSSLEREFTRLQVDPFKVYNPYSEKNAAVALLTEQMLQGDLVTFSEGIVGRADYQSLAPEEQKMFLVKEIKAQISEARAAARNIFNDFEGNEELKGDFQAYVRGRLNALSGAAKEAADYSFKLELGNSELDFTSFEELMEDINASTEYSSDDKIRLKTLYSLKYLEVSSSPDKIIREGRK